MDTSNFPTSNSFLNEANDSNIVIDDNICEQSILYSSSNNLYGSSPLTREINDLNAKINQLNFNPKVFELIKDTNFESVKKSKPTKDQRKKPQIVKGRSVAKLKTGNENNHSNTNITSKCEVHYLDNVQIAATDEQNEGKDAYQTDNVLMREKNVQRISTIQVPKQNNNVKDWKLNLHSNSESVISFDPDIEDLKINKLRKNSMPSQNSVKMEDNSQTSQTLTGFILTNNTSSKTHLSNNHHENFTNKIKKTFTKFRKESIPDSKANSSNISIIPIIDKINCKSSSKLIQELTVQQAIMKQSYKALMLCQNVTKFKSSEIRIEAEKAVLLSNIRVKTTLDEIRKLTSDLKTDVDLKSNKNNLHDLSAEIQIQDIEIIFNWTDVEELSKKNQAVYFFVLIIHNNFVWASKIVNTDEDKWRIKLLNKITLSNVSPDFKIKIQIYGTTEKCNMRMNYETDNYKSRGKCTKQAKCFLDGYNSDITDNIRKLSSQDLDVHINSLDIQLKLVGELELNIKDVHHKSPWILNKVPEGTIIQNYIHFNMSCKINIPISISGYAMHGDLCQGYIMWSQKWCVLKDHYLKLWNSPLEQHNPPRQVLDLMDCISSSVQTNNKLIYVKPRSLLIQTITKETNKRLHKDPSELQIKKIKRNLFSFESDRDLNAWTSNINQVLLYLKMWKTALPTEFHQTNNIT